MNVWNQRSDESAKAFEAFDTYLRMGSSRSLEAVAQQLNKSKQLMGRWSRTYDWVNRVLAFENQKQTALTVEVIEDVIAKEREDRKRERKERRLLMQAWKAKIAALMNDLGKGQNGETGKPLSAADVLGLSRILESYMNQSRKEYNDEPTQRLEHTGKDGAPIEQRVTNVDEFADVFRQIADYEAGLKGT